MIGGFAAFLIHRREEVVVDLSDGGGCTSSCCGFTFNLDDTNALSGGTRLGLENMPQVVRWEKEFE